MLSLFAHAVNAGWVAFFALSGAGLTVSTAPDPTPTSVPVRLLTEPEAQSVLLQPQDLPGSFRIEPGSESDSSAGCLDGIDQLPPAPISAQQNLTDDLFAFVSSAVESYESAGQAEEVMSGVEAIASSCKEISIEGAKFTVTVIPGPIVGSDAQLMLTVNGGAAEGFPVTIDLLFDRVANNVGLVGMVSAGISEVSFVTIAQRFHDKLAAVSVGLPVPPTEADKQQAAKQLKFGETYQGTRSAVTVSSPQPYAASDSASVTDGRHIVLTVKVVNRGTDVMPSYNFSSSATCGGVDAPEIYDSAGGLESSPPGDILPGRQVSWEIGFTVSPKHLRASRHIVLRL